MSGTTSIIRSLHKQTVYPLLYSDPQTCSVWTPERGPSVGACGALGRPAGSMFLSDSRPADSNTLLGLFWELCPWRVSRLCRIWLITHHLIRLRAQSRLKHLLEPQDSVLILILDFRL